MARNLRSSTTAKAPASQPATPRGVPATPDTSASQDDSARPRKQRKTGPQSRVATTTTETPQAAAQSGAPDTAPRQNWDEPAPRILPPSWHDTRHHGEMSSEKNIYLQTMRGLGQMPTNADVKLVGLDPRPLPPTPLPRNEPFDEVNGQVDGVARDRRAPKRAVLKATKEEELNAFRALPIPISADMDVDTMRLATEEAIRLAYDTNKPAVIGSLVRMWEKCGDDGFSLSLMHDASKPNAGTRDKLMFQSMLNGVWQEGLLEDDEEIEPGADHAVGRPRSASSVSSLSTAKSVDAEPVALPAPTARGKRGGRRGRGGAARRSRHSAFPSHEQYEQRMRAREQDPAFSDEAIEKRRQRMRKRVPKTLARGSNLRFSASAGAGPSLASRASTGFEYYEDQDQDQDQQPERAPSVASSDAPDNRRLSPGLRDDNDDDDEEEDNDDTENNDFCLECNGSGQLLCCDGCINSYHFSCLNPPLDPANPPDGDWFCPKCSIVRPMRALLSKADKLKERDFNLPNSIRDYFAGVRTGDDGIYEDTLPFPRRYRTQRGSRTGLYDDPFLYKIYDQRGQLITCTACLRTADTADGPKPIIHCDYCPCAWHLDCLDPPLTCPPIQRSDTNRYQWMCPNHVYHDLKYSVEDENGYEVQKRIRRPKRPRIVDVEVLPEEDESEELEEQEEAGIVYRVAEKGLQLSFIEAVHRQNMARDIKQAVAPDFFNYAKTEFDKLHTAANEIYESMHPETVPAASAVLNSRTDAERDAAANLIAMAQQNQHQNQHQAQNQAQDQTQTHDQDMDHSDPSSTPGTPTTTASQAHPATGASSQAQAHPATSASSQAHGAPTTTALASQALLGGDQIGLLIDQLRASAPADLPSSETEISSLLSLQGLIQQRLERLRAEDQKEKQ